MYIITLTGVQELSEIISDTLETFDGGIKEGTAALQQASVLMLYHTENAI